MLKFPFSVNSSTLFITFYFIIIQLSLHYYKIYLPGLSRPYLNVDKAMCLLKYQHATVYRDFEHKNIVPKLNVTIPYFVLSFLKI